MGFYDLEDGSDPFGVSVWLPSRIDRPMGMPDGSWAIGLPHQCDDWAIAMSADRDKVLAEARRFRDELDQAIARLEAG